MFGKQSPQALHLRMSSVRSKGTKLELIVRKWLWAHGYRYRLNVKSVPGKPDIVLRKYRTAIFVNGCFWHGHEGCKLFVLPKSNVDFWKDKIEHNRARDQRNYDILTHSGWQVIVLWQCKLSKQALETTMQSVAVALNHNLIRLCAKST